MESPSWRRFLGRPRTIFIRFRQSEGDPVTVLLEPIDIMVTIVIIGQPCHYCTRALDGVEEHVCSPLTWLGHTQFSYLKNGAMKTDLRG